MGIRSPLPVDFDEGIPPGVALGEAVTGHLTADPFSSNPSGAMKILPVLVLLLLVASPAAAQTVFVTTGDDLIDIDPNTGTIADLPGPDGKVSFSEALIATNNTAGHQTIGFQIPQSEWRLQFLYPGRAVLQSIIGFYWRASDEVTIDGTTQTAFTGNTYTDGGEVVLYGHTLYLNADNCTLIGFDSSSVSVTGSFGTVRDNTSMNIDLFSGSGSLVQNNTGGTIKIDRSSNNVIVGNTVNRVRVWGFGSSQLALNNRIGGPDPADRNFVVGYGTWNSDGYPAGTAIELFATQGTVIENNWIGTTTDGLAKGNAACTIGISFSTENRDTVIRNNLVAGILGEGRPPHAAGLLFGWAILMAGTGSGIEITGNTIGLDANGQPLLGSAWGIDVGNPVTHLWTGSDVRIGGPLPGEGNVIAGHIFNGVTVGRDPQQVRMQGNSFYANGWLAIDLIPSGYGYGVTPNDPLDLDTGANGLQNFPDVQSATQEGAGLRVAGSLQSSASSSFTVEFFASSECDPSGFGEAEVFLGATAVTTDAAGDAAFDLLLPTSAPAGWFVTGTATHEPEGATSELSACVPITGVSLALLGDLVRGQSADLQVSGAVPGEGVWFLDSLAGTGAGPCVGQLGGLCLDLLSPVVTLGSAVADPAGVATISGTVPPNAPLVDVHFQSVIRRGPGGADSVKTGIVTSTILP